MAGGKKESGPARWLKSAKSVFRGGHSTSSFSRSGGQASGSASPITSAASATTHGSNSLTLTGAHRIHGASVLTASPVIPEQLLRSGQKVSTAPENATTAPDSLVSQSSAQSQPNTPTGVAEPQNSTPGGSSSTIPSVSPSTKPNDGMLASIHVTIEEIKSAQKVMEDKKWYYTNRHGRQVDVGERMRRILRSVEDCAKIVDVAIQHHPEITALVWAGARFILMVAVNRVQLLDNLEAAMVTIVEKMATCEYYAQIYDECLRVKLATSTTTKALDEGLDAALKDLYAAVRAFLDKAREYFDPEINVTKKIMNHLKPFSVTMQPLIQDILDKEKIVEKYAEMATMGRIKEDSNRLQQVRDVIMQIREEMKPLVKLDEILDVAKGVRDTLTEIQTQASRGPDELTIVNEPDKEPQQREMLSPKSLDSELQELKTKYLAESRQTDIFDAKLYVPARGMETQHAPEEEHFDLWERLEKFMLPESPQRVCLILGAAGAGKSTFNHYLATRLWEAYDKNTSSTEDVPRPIPVFIPLANFHDPTRPNQDLVAELFKRRKWPEERILKAREELEFVFILDGYDEIENRNRNFYIDYRLEEWNGKIVITSRPEYLGSRYQLKFHPPGQPPLLQEYWLAPFSTMDITDYISKYVQAVIANDPPEAPSRSVKDYEQLVEQPELRGLISNPFLLKMVMTVQPSPITSGVNMEFKRVTLYRRFLDHWLLSAEERLSRIQLPSTLVEPFDTLCEENFTANAEAYCLEFAVALYRHNSLEACYFLEPGQSATKRRANETWGPFLANKNPQKRLLRYSSPLVRVGQSYRFLHKSLRDFAVARSIWQEEDLCTPRALLNEFPIVDDSGVVDFIVEESEQNQELQGQLLACVEVSKQNPKVAIAAANAITILVRAGKRFHGYNLRGVCIPGADISTGWFEGAQLQNADLRRTRLDRIWLRGADLTEACIDGGEFGEKPYFRLEDPANNNIISCFYSPNSELLVAAANYTTHDLTVWSVSTRSLLHTFMGHLDNITCVAFPLNGGHNLLASASWDCTVRLWSTQNQDAKLVHTFELLKWTWGESVAFSPDAKFLASGCSDSVVRLWCVATYDLIQSISCSEGWIYSVAFSPDGQTLASAGRSNLVELWRTETGKLLQTLRGHSDYVINVAFESSGQILASASVDKCLKIWSVSHGQLIHTFTGHAGGIHMVVFSPDSQMIATASSDNSVRIWSVASRRPLHVMEGIPTSNLAFSRDGELLTTGADDGIIRQWLARELSISIRVGNSHIRAVNDVTFSYDTKLLASAGSDQMVHIWSMDTLHKPDLVNVLALPSAAVTVLFSPKSALLVTGALDGKIRLHKSFQNKSSSPHEDLLGTHLPRVNVVAMTPDGNILASGGDDREIRLWSIPSGERIVTLQGHTDCIRAVAFSPDGQLLVSGSEDQTIRLWSVPPQEMLHTYEGHTADVFHVAFSPDGEAIASASRDNTVRLWPVPDRKSLHIFEGHTHHVTRVTFSPDGFLLASGSQDNTMRFWSLASRELVLVLNIQTEVKAFAWTPSTSAEGGLIAIGRGSGGVQLLQVIHKPGYSRKDPEVELSWLWATDQGAYLNVYGARIEGITGLDPTNIELLNQRGAIGKPVVRRVQEVLEEA